jgi:hypothetical protein
MVGKRKSAIKDVGAHVGPAESQLTNFQESDEFNPKASVVAL